MSFFQSMLQRPVQKINSMLNRLLNIEDKEVEGDQDDINLVSATSGIDSTTFTKREVSAQEIEDLVQKANAFLEKGDMNSVIDTFFAILDADPTRVDVNTVLGSVLMSMKKYDLAQTFLYTAVTQVGCIIRFFLFSDTHCLSSLTFGPYNLYLYACCFSRIGRMLPQYPPFRNVW